MVGADTFMHCIPIFINYRMTVNLYVFELILYIRNNLFIFDVRNSLHEHMTRNNYLLQLPQLRLMKSQINYIYQRLKLYLATVYFDVALQSF